MGDVNDAGQREHHRPDTNDDASGPCAVVGVSHDSDRECEQQDRDGPGEPAERPRDDHGHDRVDRSASPPPRNRADDDGTGDEAQAEAVAPMGGVEITCSVADPTDAPADDVTEPEPDRSQRAADCAEQPSQQAGASTATRRRSLRRPARARGGRAGR